MATTPATHEQELAIYGMNPGDVFTFRDRGQVREATFVKQKQVNIVGVMDGTQYNIPKCLFIAVKEKAAAKPAPKMDMKPGELFYIVSKSEAVVFEFVRIEKYTIIAKNIITGGQTRIHQSMFAGTIKQYQQQQRQLAKAE